jgi:hypothetical protein
VICSAAFNLKLAAQQVIHEGTTYFSQFPHAPEDVRTKIVNQRGNPSAAKPTRRSDKTDASG